MAGEAKAGADAALALVLITLIDLLVKKDLLERQEILAALSKTRASNPARAPEIRRALELLISSVSGVPVPGYPRM